LRIIGACPAFSDEYLRVTLRKIEHIAGSAAGQIDPVNDLSELAN
jgi:hypothetical protein